jgi:outer membrane protein assembly factor BamB
LARLRQPALRWEQRTAVGTPRRRLVLIAVSTLLMLAALAAVAGGWRPFEAPAGADWSGYRGGPSRASLGDNGPVGAPVLHWRFQAGDSVKDAIAIAADLVIAPSQDGVVHAIGIADGAERWRFAPGTSVSAPYVDGELVFVVDGRGRLHALQLATGAERWVSSEVLDTVSSPIVDGGLIILGTGDGDLVALDARTGDRRWRVTLSQGAVRDPAAGPGMIVAGTVDGVLVAVRSSDGSTLWTKDFQGDPLGTATVAANIVYTGSRSDEPGGRLRALDAATGNLLWQTDEPWFAPAVGQGLAISGRIDGLIVARDARTGVERWRFASGGSTRGPAIYGSTVVFGVDPDAWIGAVDVATGGLLWRYDVEGSNQCCVAVAKGYVVVGTMAGTVYAIGGDGSTPTPTSPPALPPSQSASAPSTEPPSPSASAFAELPEAYRIVERLSPEATGIDDPLAVAVGPDGDIYVTDTSMRVARIRPDGTILRWGSPGAGDGQFDFLAAAANANAHGSIAVAPDGTVYVSDSDNHRIQVFTPDGRYLDQFGSIGSEPGQFTIPFDLGVDANGNVYAVDDGLRRLTKFDPSGRPIWVVDGSKDRRLDGHLHTPRIDDQGRITVANDDLGLVVVLGPDGSVLDSFEAPTCGVSVDPGVRFHIVDCTGRGWVYDSSRTAVAATRNLNLITVELGPDGQIVGLDRNGDVLRLAMASPSVSPAP